MTGRFRWGLAALAALAALSLCASPGAAEPPEDAAWGSLSLEGAPVDAGFLADGALVYGTTGTEAVPGATEGDCSLDAETPDLYLVSFPEEPGCLGVLDTSGQAEGVAALATSHDADLALVALPIDGAGTLADDNLVLYERDDENLTEAWRTQVNGEIVDVELDPDGERGAVTFQTGTGNHRLVVFSAAGDRQLNTRVPGEPRALTVSDNARYVALGGNQTQDGESLGWAHVYDLSEDGSDPVLERTIPRPRAGIVTATAVTDEGTLYAGLLDGTVRWVREGGNDREVSLATDPVRLDVTADGDSLFAAAGNESARLTVEDDQLATEWRARLNGSAQAAFLRLPHLFAVADTVNAIGPDGEGLWEITAGSVVAVNRTGLGAVVASEIGDGGAASARTSVLEGRVLHRNLTLDQEETITVTPGGVARENATLHNTGAAILDLAPTADAEGLRLHATPESLQVLPGERRQVSFTVEATSDAAPGTRTIAVDPGARPSVATTLELEVEVSSRPNVTVELGDGEVPDRDVTQGQTISIRLDLANRGNAEADVDLELLQTVDDPWPHRVSPNETLTVPPGSVTTARVEVDVPADEANGTANRVIVTGESPQGASAVQVNLTVNPFQVIRIRPDSISQEMAPGDSRPYDLSVENLGSVDADVRLRLQPIDADGDPCLPTVWGLTLGASRVTVPAQGSQPVRVEISAPPDVPVPEVQNGTAGCTADAQRPTLRVELQGVSDDGSRDHSLLFANVDPTLADEDEDPDRNDGPFPVLVTVLVVVGAAAATVQGGKP